MHAQREVWLDAIRGITISLVVLNHCIQAVAALLSKGVVELHFLVFNVNNALGLVRMPAFFLCSGILFAICAERGWGWFVKKRLAWSIWIIVLWSWAAILLMGTGFELYPWNPAEDVGLMQALLVEPTGNMWFVYAIALLGAFCMAIKSTSPTASLLIALGLSVIAIFAVERVVFPDGIERVLWNLGTRGLLFFTIGFVFSKQLMMPRRRNVVGAVAGLMMWAACYYVMKKVGGSSNFHRMALSLPATFSAIYVLQYLLTRLPAAADWLSVVGKRSLHLFLLHQFFIAAAYVALQPLVAHVAGEVVLSIMFLVVMAASYAAANLMEKAPGNPFFSIPPGVSKGGALVMTRKRRWRVS